MSLLSRALAWRYRFPAAQTTTVPVERGIRVPMGDGTVLLADRYGSPGQPTVLVRTPYGRHGLTALIARLFAERGMQVFVQSARGTFGSGGDFEPFEHERADGLATIAWIVKQPWFSGKLATYGPSYLGYTQWAVSDAAEIQAMAPQVTCSNLRDMFYLGGGFALDDILGWAVGTTYQGRPLNIVRTIIAGPRKVRRHVGKMPLGELDTAVVGRPIPMYQGWIRPDDAYWTALDRSKALPSAPVHMLAGWYDLFLPFQLRDYAAMRAAGHEPYLTIGPWAHTSPEAMAIGIIEALGWFRAHLHDDRSALRALPVRVHVTGGGGWRDLHAWPPPPVERRWHPAPGGVLSPEAGDGSDRYRYDPADPTPSIGGPLLNDAGVPVDNRPLEQRPDVLVYSGAPLTVAAEVIGEPTADLRVRSSREHTDFFVRLCDVNSAGVSTNVTEGVVRCEPGMFPVDADGVMHVTVPLRACAHRFERGHRIRFQVSSGAHPRIARNPGTGEPLASAVTMVAADQEVLHTSYFTLV